MPVIINPFFELTESDILRRQEIEDNSRIRLSVKIITTDLLSKIKEYLIPAIAYEYYPVRRFTSQYLYLENGHKLKLGGLVSRMGKSREIAAISCTIGTSLEERVNKYFLNGDSLKGFLLDGIGSAAIDALAREACKLINAEVASRGYVSSIPFSPGLGGWDINEIPDLLRLAVAERIGISATSGGMMLPCKSIVMVTGIGNNVGHLSHNDTCRFCDMWEVCHHRR